MIGPGAVRQLLDGVGEVLDDALELYLELHREPELSGAERRTADRLARWLTGCGYTVAGGLGGHGVVGMLRTGPGPVVLLRAELDALPVQEDTGLPYASTVDGVMHACGHDAHIACLAAAARLLARRSDWTGTVLVVGQPAEETLRGAAALLADGLYSRWPRPDVALAQHVAPLPAGLVGHATGAVTAASAVLHVTIPGRGGHGAMPHLVLNPIGIAAGVVAELDRLAADAGVVLTVGALHAGTAANVVPDEAHIDLVLRGFAEAALDDAVERVRRLAVQRCAGAGSPREPDVVVVSRSRVQHNEPATAAVVRRCHEAVFGAGRVSDCPPSTATEDFPLYTAADGDLPPVPTVYWMLGSVGARQWAATPGTTAREKLTALPANHSPRFAPEPVATLRAGTAALAAAALGCLHRTAPAERRPTRGTPTPAA